MMNTQTHPRAVHGAVTRQVSRTELMNRLREEIKNATLSADHDRLAALNLLLSQWSDLS